MDLEPKLPHSQHVTEVLGPAPDFGTSLPSVKGGVGRTKDPGVRVQRHSPHRLLRQKLVLPGGITISAEKHRGRVMVRIEVPECEL